MSTGARLKEPLKTLAKKSLYKAGYYHIRRHFAANPEKKLVVLMYHNLTADDGRAARRKIDGDTCARSQLEAHFRELARGHRVVSVKDAAAEIRSGGGLQENSVAITFDDGNESVYKIAYPLLIKYDLPATVFVVSSWVDTGHLSWWQHLYELLEKADLSDIRVAQIHDIFGPHAPSFSGARGADFAARRRFAHDMEPLLRATADDERAEKLDRFQKLLFPRGDFVPKDSRVLTWEQINEMAGKKIDFESHTRTHINIPTTDISVVEEEILRSKEEIERHTRREVTGFAYPYGQDISSYLPVEPVLRERGFAYACNACPGTNPASANVYSLYRYCLPLTTSPALINRELCVVFSRDTPHRS